MGKTPVMHRTAPIGLIAALGALALLALAGCGSDSSGESATTAPQASAPVVTSPLGTGATQTATAPGGQKPAKTTNTTGGTAPGACSVPDAYQDFKYTGIDCTAAVAVATAWDDNGKDCNTVDNPDVPEGYKRTCSVEGFTCEAKRDVHSDGRFVTCTQGGQSIRFTWLPA
jgi:hypothetical protein